jgi:hypothetical protein
LQAVAKKKPGLTGIPKSESVKSVNSAQKEPAKICHGKIISSTSRKGQLARTAGVSPNAA